MAAEVCTECQTPVSLTPDWTLWPWPDGARLCTPCNETRHEQEDYSEVEQAVATAAQARVRVLFQTQTRRTLDTRKG